MVLPVFVVPHDWPTVLAVVLLLAGAAAIAAGLREQVLALRWEDWICAQAARGQRQLNLDPPLR